MLIQIPNPRPNPRHKLLLAITGATLLTLAGSANYSQVKDPNAIDPPVFNREQTMVINLNHGYESTGYFVVTSLKKSKEINKDLGKALSQLEQVDKTFAKSRGKPDSRYLAGAASRIEEAQKTADLLENQLRDAYKELKSSIEQTLILN